MKHTAKTIMIRLKANLVELAHNIVEGGHEGMKAEGPPAFIEFMEWAHGYALTCLFQQTELHRQTEAEAVSVQQSRDKAEDAQESLSSKKEALAEKKTKLAKEEAGNAQSLLKALLLYLAGSGLAAGDAAMSAAAFLSRLDDAASPLAILTCYGIGGGCMGGMIYLVRYLRSPKEEDLKDYLYYAKRVAAGLLLLLVSLALTFIRRDSMTDGTNDWPGIVVQTLAFPVFAWFAYEAFEKAKALWGHMEANDPQIEEHKKALRKARTELKEGQSQAKGIWRLARHQKGIIARQAHHKKSAAKLLLEDEHVFDMLTYYSVRIAEELENDPNEKENHEDV